MLELFSAHYKINAAVIFKQPMMLLMFSSMHK